MVVGFLVETVCAGVGMWAYIGNSRVPLPLPGIPLDGSLLSHQLHMGKVNPLGRRLNFSTIGRSRVQDLMYTTSTWWQLGHYYP